jgi:hypothetical protein
MPESTITIPASSETTESPESTTTIPASSETTESPESTSTIPDYTSETNGVPESTSTIPASTTAPSSATYTKLTFVEYLDKINDDLDELLVSLLDPNLVTDSDLEIHIENLRSGILKTIQSSPRELRSRATKSIDLNNLTLAIVEVADEFLTAKSINEWPTVCRAIGKKISLVRPELATLRFL